MKGYLQWQLAMPKGGLILGKKITDCFFSTSIY